MKTLPVLVIVASCLIAVFSACSTIDDVQSTAALRNVEFTFDSLHLQYILPAGALDGQSFAQLREQQPEIYSNPANYGVEISSHYTGDNKKSSARDASFSGMIQDIVFSEHNEDPLRLNTPAFTVKAQEKKNIVTEGNVNLQTHRLPGLYIFRQTVDGQPIDTSILTDLLYKIGNQEGFISLPRLQQDIPTRASDELKAFLSDLLDSGILNE